MSSEMKIVICMSTYNGERFIRKQIQSFIDQTYKNWVLLVHDDGSTDSTVEIVQQFAESDSRIQMMMGQPHWGIKKSFINLLSIAEGNYYAFSDQDDIWHADKLKTLVRRFDDQVNPDVPALAFSEYEKINADDEIIPEYDEKRPFVTALESLLFYNTVTGCTVMMNHKLRDALIDHRHQLDYDHIHMHDWWAALVASAIGEIIYVPEKLVSYRQHGKNVLGATKKVSRWQKLSTILAVRDRDILLNARSQDKQLLGLYERQISNRKREQVKASLDIFSGWRPLKKIAMFKKHGFRIGSRSVLIQLYLWLFMPPALRSEK